MNHDHEKPPTLDYKRLEFLPRESAWSLAMRTIAWLAGVAAMFLGVMSTLATIAYATNAFTHPRRVRREAFFNGSIITLVICLVSFYFAIRWLRFSSRSNSQPDVVCDLRGEPILRDSMIYDERGHPIERPTEPSNPLTSSQPSADEAPRQ